MSPFLYNYELAHKEFLFDLILSLLLLLPLLHLFTTAFSLSLSYTTSSTVCDDKMVRIPSSTTVGGIISWNDNEKIGMSQIVVKQKLTEEIERKGHKLLENYGWLRLAQSDQKQRSKSHTHTTPAMSLIRIRHII